ncbi:MAG: two-component sensor histidine kinase, partial [Christensenellales bacterium]
MIESGMAQGEQAKTFAAEIHKSANRLLTLINDIIRLSQMDAPMPDLKFEPVDLAQIAANTFEQLEMSARKADVTLQLDAKPAMVEADRQMM